MSLTRKLLSLVGLGAQTTRDALAILRGREAVPLEADRAPASDFLDAAWGFSPERPERRAGPESAKPRGARGRGGAADDGSSEDLSRPSSAR